LEVVPLPWSGVISNDLDVVVATSNALYRHFGVEPVTKDEFRAMFAADWLEQYTSKGITASREEIMALWRKHWCGNGSAQSISGAVDAVIELKRNGKQIITVSSQDQSLLEREAEHFELRHELRGIHGNTLKNDSAILRRLLAGYHVEPQGALYVDDTDFDVLFGHGAGLRAVGVLSGYHTKDRFEGSPYTALLPSIQDLVKHV